MKAPQLVVVVSQAPQPSIQQAFPKHRYVNDSHIFDYLNGALFDDNKVYGLDTIEQFCDALVDLSKSMAIVVHTFNPIIQNYLMCYKPRLSEHDAIEDDLNAARKRFLLWQAQGENGQFFSALDIPIINGKLNALCIGDAIADTCIEDEIKKINLN